jgi:hypothetical protein
MSGAAMLDTLPSTHACSCRMKTFSLPGLLPKKLLPGTGRLSARTQLVTRLSFLCYSLPILLQCNPLVYPLWPCRVYRRTARPYSGSDTVSTENGTASTAIRGRADPRTPTRASARVCTGCQGARAGARGCEWHRGRGWEEKGYVSAQSYWQTRKKGLSRGGCFHADVGR